MISSNQKHRPTGAPPKAAPVFFVSDYIVISDIFMDIPYVFHIYIYIYICPKYFPYIFLCMFRNLFSQQ